MTSGPESNFENATTVGTLVHLIGLFFGFVGTGLVYLFSDDEFTKQNAKNAFNWQIIFVVAFGAFVLVAFFDTFFSALITIIGIISLFTLDLAFCVWATIKAKRGTIWKYPFVPDIV